MRKKGNINWLFVVFLAVTVMVGLLSFKNIILKALLESSIYTVSGLRLSVEKIDVGLLRPYIRAEGLTLLNPPDFPPGVMFEIPLLYIEYDLEAVSKRRVHIKDMDFQLKTLNVVRNDKGMVNLDYLNIVKLKKGGARGEAPMPVAIDRLHLKGGTVIYTDYRYSPPRVNEFDVNIDERYENISDPYALGEIIVSRSLYGTSVPQLAGFNVGALQTGAAAVVSKGTGIVKDAAKSTMATLSEVDKKAAEMIESTKGVIREIVGQPSPKEEHK